MLHIFTVERVATGFDRGSDDQRVEKRRAMIAREQHGCGMRVDGDGNDLVEQIAKQPERKFDLRPVVVQLPPGDMDELVQHLNAGEAAAAQAIDSLLPLGSDVAA